MPILPRMFTCGRPIFFVAAYIAEPIIDSYDVQDLSAQGLPVKFVAVRLMAAFGRMVIVVVTSPLMMPCRYRSGLVAERGIHLVECQRRLHNGLREGNSTEI